jgi:hypothetical protein
MKSKLFVVIVVFLSPFVSAQNVREAAQNTAQIQEGRQMLARDVRELEEFDDKIELLTLMFDSKNQDRANVIKETLLLDMMKEVRQSGVKAKQARIEIAQSSAEVRSDNREVRRDRNDSADGGRDRRDDKKDLARDKMNQRDDRRDRRDDIRDFEAQVERAEKQKEVLDNLKMAHLKFGYFSRENAMAKKVLIQQFRKTMVEDIEATRRELGEDKREQGEDRRERRDDRHERNERR